VCGYSDEAVVVRGGAQWSREGLISSAEAHYRDRGEYALTVWSFPDKTAKDIVFAVGDESFPHGKIRVSTAGRLRSVGFEVIPSEANQAEPPGHVDVKPNFNQPLHDASADAFIAAFDPPIPNPLRVRRG
jgi:hypothetical protein